MKKLLLGLILLASMSSLAIEIDVQTDACAKHLTYAELVSTYEGAVKVCQSTNVVERSYAQKLEYFGYVKNLSEGLAISSMYNAEEIDSAMSLVRANKFDDILSALQAKK